MAKGDYIVTATPSMYCSTCHTLRGIHDWHERRDCLAYVRRVPYGCVAAANMWEQAAENTILFNRQDAKNAKKRQRRS